MQKLIQKSLTMLYGALRFVLIMMVVLQSRSGHLWMGQVAQYLGTISTERAQSVSSTLEQRASIDTSSSAYANCGPAFEIPCPPPPPPPAPVCPDGVCNGTENCTTCPGDCGVCPVPPVCGDNVCNGTENCTTCPGDCGVCPPPPVCGNSTVETGEVCDPAGSTNADGDTCNTTCTGWICQENCNCPAGFAGGGCNSGNGTCFACTKIPVCGDSVLDNGEVCDAGASNGTTIGGCNTTCTGLVPGVCGNGTSDRDEVCDGSAGDGGPGVTCVSCQRQAVCGDGVVGALAGEACDAGSANSWNTGATCTPTCQLPVCGDNHVNQTSGTEQCDLGGANSNTPNALCRNNCLDRRCGDGIIDTDFGEQCDTANTPLGHACNSQCKITCSSDSICQQYVAATHAPLAFCHSASSSCRFAVCGDGKVEGVEDPICELPVADRPSGTQCTDFCTQVVICGDGKAIEVSFDIQTYGLTKVGTNILSGVGLIPGTGPNDPYFGAGGISYTHTDASGNNWFVGGAYGENSSAGAAYHYALDPIGNFVAGSARSIGTTQLGSVGLGASQSFGLGGIKHTHTDASGNNWFVGGAHGADYTAGAAYHYALDPIGNFVAGSARKIGTTQLGSVGLGASQSFGLGGIKHTHTDASGNNWFVGGAWGADFNVGAAYHYALDPIGNFVAGSARSIGTTQLSSVGLGATISEFGKGGIKHTHTDASGNNWFVGGAEGENSSVGAAYHYALDPIGNFVAGSARKIGTTQLGSVGLGASQFFGRGGIKHTHTDASGNNWFVGGAEGENSSAGAAYHYALDPIGNFVAGSARKIGTTQLGSVGLGAFQRFGRGGIKHTHTDASGNNWFVGGAHGADYTAGAAYHYALDPIGNFVAGSARSIGTTQLGSVGLGASQYLGAGGISYTHTDASGNNWFVGGAEGADSNAGAAYHYRGNGSITQSLVKKSESCDLGSVCVGGSNAGIVCTGTPGVCTGGGTCEVRNSADCQQCQMACASTTYCPAGKGTTHDIVAVVDRSGSMLFPDYSCVGNTCTPGPNAAITRIKNGINNFLQNFPKQGSDQVSIVSYATTATTDVPLQTSFSNYSAHTTAVNNWTAAGRTNLTDALKRAYDEITGPDARDDATKIVIVFTDGEPNESNCESPRFGTINNASANDACEQAAIYRADQIKNAGGYIYSIFYVQENITSANINDTRTMMQTISSNPNNYYFEEQTISNISRLNEFFGDIGEDHCGFCPSPLCGNGTINAPEICDDGKHCSNGTACSSVADCPSLYDACIPRDFGTCNAACTGTDPVPFCGNSTTEAAGGDGVVGTFDDEECDLGTDPFVGNGAPGSTCSQYCKLYICGNNVLDPGEECDDGDTDNTDSCKNDCTVNVCGDGVVNEGMNPETGLPFETCDLGALNGQTAQPCTDTCQEACLFHEDCESGYACETGECKPFCGVFSFDVSTTPVLGGSVTVSYLTDAFTSNTNEQMLVSDPTGYTTVVNATSTTQTLSQAGERVFTYRTTVADSDSINNVITCQMPLAVACSDSSQCPADSACMGPVGEKQCQPVCTDPDITDPNAGAIWVDETISIACNGAAGVTTSSMDIVVSDLNGIELTRVTDNNLDYSPTTQGYYVFTCQPSVVTDPETGATATVSCMQVEPVFEAICGNGAVEGTEQCDDGNTDNNDGCNDQCEPEVPTPGVCGGANGNTYAYNATGYAPDLQCATGTPSSTEFPTQGMTVTWTCSGLYSGATSADCSASRETPPVCGSANQTYPNGSTDYGSDTFCNPGSATPVTPAFPTAGQTVTWTCTQPQGGDPVNCSAFQASPDPVNGVCGGANGNTYTHDVTSYGSDIQCVTGNPSTTDFPAAGGTVTWSCDGLNGGTTESGCSASRDPAPVCGGANGNTYAYNATGYAPDTQCTSGTPSTTDFPDQGGSVSRTCSAPNGGPTVSCSASRALPPVCGSANQTYPNGSTDYGSDTFCNPGSATPTTPAFPTAGQTVTWTCTQPQGGDPVNCEATQASPDPINGVCGGANGNTYTHDVTSYGADIQCVTGNPSTTDFPAAGGTVTWSCDGLNGGTTESGCSASRDPAPVCGGANGNTYAYNATGYAPDTQCTSGTPSTTDFPVQGGSVSRTCSAPNGGPTASCSASRALPPVCGSANQTYPNGSTDYGSDTFCNPGSATPVTPAFPTAGQTVTWTCTQPQGGDPVNCSAFQASPDPVNGVCGGANGNTYTHDVTSYGADIQCVTGNPSTTDFPAAGGTVTWSCDGLNGGTNESGCSASRDPAPVCGGANGNTYAYNATGYAPDTQCASGTPSTTDFPDQGGSVSRTCSAPNGGPTASCSASRALPPVCGSANQTYPNGSTDYGSDTFCNPGSATPVTPAFPTAGQTVTWTCTQPQGGDPVNCEATQGNPFPVCAIPPHDTDYYQRRTLRTIPYSGDLCSVGTVSDLMYSGGALGVDEYGQWTWTCSTIIGDISCIAHHNYCGNGILEGTEQCDDGNADNTDGCTTRCRSSGNAPLFCGDGIVQQPNSADEIELCDEGINNGQPGSMCGVDCLPLEESLDGICTTAILSGSYYTPDAPDQSLLCDQGLGTGFVFATGADGISGTWSWTCAASGTGTDASCSVGNTYCGDSIVNGAEECDDGNDIDTDECTNACESGTICVIDGYIYLDIINNDVYNTGVDSPIANIPLTLSNGATTTTNDDGYYRFQDLLCSTGYVVSYTNTTTNRSDSSQKERSINTNPLTPITLYVEATDFYNSYKDQYVSEDNNFGLVRYNLTIEKTFVSNSDAAGMEFNATHTGIPAIESGDRVTYRLEFTNDGPTTATGVTVRDIYPTSMSNFVMNQISGPTTLNMDMQSGELIFNVGDMTGGDTYVVDITATVVGNHEDSITNRATIYTAETTNDLIEEYGEDARFEDNEDEIDITIVSCAVDGVVYVDVDGSNTYNIGDIILNDIPVTVTQNDPNTPSNTNITTANGGMYMVDGLSCRHPVTISYTHDTDYTSDSAQLHQDIQQSDIMSIQVSPSQLDGNENISPNYQNHFISEDNNFGLLGYRLEISKSFVSNTSNLDNQAYPKTTTIDGVSYPVIEAGDTVVYALTFANMDTTVATGVLVKDIMPANMEYVSYQVVAGNASNLTVSHDTTLNVLNINAGNMSAGTSYTIHVTTRVTNATPTQDEIVTNRSTIYTNLGTGDTIEDNYDPNQFINNESDVTVIIEYCQTDGTIYLDIQDNDTINNSDPRVADSLVGYTNGFETFEMATNTDGYYTFARHSCRYDASVSYVHTTDYLSDSAQFENTSNNTVTPNTIEIPVSTYSAIDRASLENNFGLVGYDLWIEKSVDRSTISHDGTATYTISFGNHGPTIAYNAVVNDILDETGMFNFLPSSLTLGTLSGVVHVVWSGNSFTISDIPMLPDGDSHTITIQGKALGYGTSDLQINNRASIFVGNPETDIFERNIFKNNRDEALVTILKYVLPGGGDPTPPTLSCYRCDNHNCIGFSHTGNNCPENSSVTSNCDNQCKPAEEQPIPEEVRVTQTVIEPIKRQIDEARDVFSDIDLLHTSFEVKNLPSILPKTGSREWNLMLALIIIVLLCGGVVYGLKRRKVL